MVSGWLADEPSRLFPNRCNRLRAKGTVRMVWTDLTPPIEAIAQRGERHLWRSKSIYPGVI